MLNVLSADLLRSMTSLDYRFGDLWIAGLFYRVAVEPSATGVN
jgi:hypothetical protein